MLHTCINHPNIFNKELNGANNFYYEFLLSYFDKIIKNGIILDNEKNELITIINKNIDSWPESYRKKIQECIKVLKKSRRLIQLKKDDNFNKDVCKKCNKYDICSLFYSILYEDIDGIVVTEDCFEQLQEINNMVSINSMNGSDLDEKLKKLSYIIDENYGVDNFENDIMFPIFRYCKSIKILDRMFGNHIRDNRMELRDNYKRGLKHIIQMIKNVNININKLNIEIYTSIQQTEKRKYKIEIIEQFIEDLNDEYGLNIKCYFKEPYREFNHDRYIFTEQIGVQFGRGIDLFDENERLRKMTVSIIDNSEKRQLETNVRCLDDIEE